jgi:enterobacterial common antigen flippase
VVEVVLGCTVSVLAQAFMALGHLSIVTLLQGVGLGLSVPLMLVLIPLYGLTGAGLALLGSTGARLLFILMCFPLVLKVSPPSLLITRQDIEWLWHKILKRHEPQ